MSYRINGIGFSYDYEELLEDIKEDVKDGILTNDAIINIVRGEARQLTEKDTYRPIVDYYR